MVDSAKRTVLYRVAQEAITNVARHARAKQTTVRVRRVPAGVQLEVRDDGRGFGVHRVLKAAGGRRLGLVGMRERVEMVGGCLEIESVPGKGSVVRATVPDDAARRGATS